MERLRGKVAVISGGAGSIGAATARLFVAEGARVAVTDVGSDAFDRLAGELGDAAAAQVADATESARVRAAVELAEERFGGLDIAFANAVVFGAIAPVAEYPEDVFDSVMAVNVRGTFLLARHALAAMRDGAA